MGEESNSKSKKKVIKVRKSQTSNEIPSTSGSVNRHASRLSVASHFNKIFRPENIDDSTEQEEVLQIIDLEVASNSSKHPIEFMFPHLAQEGVDLNTLTRTMPTTDLTKLLLGHKPHFTNIHSQSRRRNAIDFTPIFERNEDDSSLESINKGLAEKPRKSQAQRPRLDSAEADAEDSDAGET